jgi:hypothetical protein
MSQETTRAPAVLTGERIQLRSLAERRDGENWVIGRADSGVFISVPEVAHRVISLLSDGRTVDETEMLLRTETGKRFAVREFVTALDKLDFISAVDGEMRPDSVENGPSCPWLRPAHVRWLLHPIAAAVVAGALVACIALLVANPALVPSYHFLVWNKHAGLVLVVNVAIGWTLILAHELAHLATARAAGVPARITISTRLQFLAAQTDVSGVWAAPRRIRITVYLAGMGLNVCVAAVCLAIIVAGGLTGLPRELLRVTVTETVLMLSTQAMVFMRTDLYFVIQDLTGCANLYAEGTGYLRHRVLRITRRGRSLNADPTQGLPRRQRRSIRAYSGLLLIGTFICLGFEFVVSLPALIVLIGRAAIEIGYSTISTLDGAVLIASLLAWQVLWCVRWWARHREQVRSLVRKLRKGGVRSGNPEPDSHG